MYNKEMTNNKNDAIKREYRNALRVRTLEILWHCNEPNKEAEQFVMQSSLIEGVTSIDYDAHTDRIVTTGGDGCIRVWQLHPNAIDTWLDNSAADMTACISHLCTQKTTWMPLTARWSPQGEMIASGHCEGKVCLWWRDKEEEKCKRLSIITTSTNRNRKECKNNADYQNSSNYMNEMELVEVWKNYRQLQGHINDVYDVCFSPCSRYLLSGAGDGRVMVHDLEGAPLPILELPKAHGRFCRGVAWDPWNQFFVSFGAGPPLQFYTIKVPLPPNVNESEPNANEKMLTSPLYHEHQQHKAILEEQEKEEEEEEEEELHKLEQEHFNNNTATNNNTITSSITSKNNHCNSYEHRHKRLRLTNTVKCEGDYLGESCALAFRRPAFSPDGLLLAVPFGKLPRAARSRLNTTPCNSDITDTTINYSDNNKNNNNNNTTSNIYSNSGNIKNDISADQFAHCVNIYARHSLDKLMCRLAIRGYNEIRGVQWAPCFFAPIHTEEKYEQQEQEVSCSTNHATEMKKNTNHIPKLAQVDEMSLEKDAPTQLVVTHRIQTENKECELHQEEQRREELEEKEEEQEEKEEQLRHQTNHKDCLSIDTINRNSNIHKTRRLEYQPRLSEMWGPAEYRMALAVWTSDAVIIYTTDSLKRHSDYTDLHMRSIIDVAWSGDGAYVYTASLDCYISVISLGNTLAPSSRLPLSYSASPLSRMVQAIRNRVDAASKSLESQRSATDDSNKRNTNNGNQVVVAVRKKKKKNDEFAVTGDKADSLAAIGNIANTADKVEAAAVAEQTEVELKQLEYLMSDAEAQSEN